MPSVDAPSVMGALATFLQGIQQNMDRRDSKQMQALSLLAKQPGMEFAQAEGAQPTNIFKRLLGLPAYEPGPSGSPVVGIGSTPFTVKAEPSAKDFLRELLSGGESQSESMAPMPTARQTTPLPSVAGASAPTDDIETLAPLQVTARRNYVKTLAERLGFDPQDIQNDAAIYQLASQKGAARKDLVKALYDMKKRKTDEAKAKLDRAEATTKLQDKIREQIGREYYGVRNDADVQAANARLAQDPVLSQYPDVLARLPQTYTPEDVKAVVNAGLPLEKLTEPQRQADILEAKGPIELRQKTAEQQAVGDVRNKQEYEQLQRTIPYRNQQELAQFQQMEPERRKTAAAHGVEAQSLNNKNRTVNAVAQKRMEALNEAATAGEKTAISLGEIEGLIAQGVYGTGVDDLIWMKSYETGLANQDDEKAARTARLKELGAKLTTDMGSLGAQVSNTDREFYSAAAGNFQKAKNPIEMQESIASMRRILIKAIDKANAAQQIYQETGEIPAFDAGGPARPAPTAPARPVPGQRMTSQDIDATQASQNAKRAKQGLAPLTRQQTIDAMKAQGLQVP